MRRYEVTFGTLAVLVALAAGFILEDVGSWIELLWDRLQDDRKANEEIWWRYLRTAFVVEPVGEGYLRTILLRMKFELSFGASLVPMLVGVLLLNRLSPFASGCHVLVFAAITVVIFAFVMEESCRSACLLAEIRRRLCEQIVVVGSKDTNPASDQAGAHRPPAAAGSPPL
jgi:hypothetical protein